MHPPPLEHVVVRLVAALADPRRDAQLLAEAGLAFDPSLLALVTRLSLGGPASVGELARDIGRDPSAASRQVARLERLGLVGRLEAGGDRRVSRVDLTDMGEEAARALAGARRRLLGRLTTGWPTEDRTRLAELLARLADAVEARPPPVTPPPA